MNRLSARPAGASGIGFLVLFAVVLLSLPAVAQSATTFGEDMIYVPTEDNAGMSLTRAYNNDGSLNPGSPVGGVLTTVNLISTGNASSGYVRVIRRQTLFSGGAADFLNATPHIPWTVTADLSAGGHVTTIPTRRKIAAGDQLALVNSDVATLMYFLGSAPADCAFSYTGATPGTTGSYTSTLCNRWIPIVQGVVEPDADNDGYGDETQDGCPTDASSHTDCPPAGTAFVGDGISSNPTWTNDGVTITPSIEDDGTNHTGFAYAGVLTSVQVRSGGTAGTGVVHVLRNTTPVNVFPISFLNVGPDIPFSVAAAGGPSGAITTVATRQPVSIGDRFGLVNNSGSTTMFYSASGSGDCVFNGSPPHPAGAVQNYTNAGCNNYIPLVRGVVEPDADGDGYGDVSQDGCPADATRQGPCAVLPTTADLQLIVKRAAAIRSGRRTTRTYKVTNAGPLEAGNVVFRVVKNRKLRSITVLSGTCRPARNKRSCTLARLAPGATVTVKVRLVSRTAQKVKVKANVESSTPDGNSRNNAVTTTYKFKA